MCSSTATSDRPVVVVDCGGGYIRAGFAHEAKPSVVEPNCTATTKVRGSRGLLVGSEALQCPAYAIHRPSCRGLVLDIEQQRVILKKVFHNCLGIDPRECALLITEAPLTPASLRREMEECFFGAFRFREVCILSAPPLALYSPDLRKQLDCANPCCTVLSLGHSGCVALPCVEGQALLRSTRRLDVGGRVLTNLLMERLGVRHFDLADNWLLVEDILIKVGEVSVDFANDLHERFASVKPKTYVLPDFHTRMQGFVREDIAEEPQELHLANASGQQKPTLQAGEQPQQPQQATLRAERVVVAEALFRPTDQGLRHGGLPQLVQHAIMAVQEETWKPHFGQVALCGGLARLPNLRSRLQWELRQLLPTSWPVKILVEDEPELSVWRGAAKLAQNSEFRRSGFRTRRTWEEEGRSRIQQPPTPAKPVALAVGVAKRKAPA